MVEVVRLRPGEQMPVMPDEQPWLTVEASDDGRFFGKRPLTTVGWGSGRSVSDLIAAVHGNRRRCFKQTFREAAAAYRSGCGNLAQNCRFKRDLCAKHKGGASWPTPSQLVCDDAHQQCTITVRTPAL